MTSFQKIVLLVALAVQGCSQGKDAPFQVVQAHPSQGTGEIGNDGIAPTHVGMPSEESDAEDASTTIRPTIPAELPGESATGGSTEGTAGTGGATGTTGSMETPGASGSATHEAPAETGVVLAPPPHDPLSDLADRYGGVVPSTVPASGLLAPGVGSSTIQIPALIDPRLIGSERARFPGVLLNPRLLSSKVQVLTRDEQGRLHVCEGSSAAAKWENGARCFDIPASGHDDGEYVVGQPAAVYQTGAFGTALHILARTNRGGMTWTVCRADDLTQCRTYLPFFGDNIRENPSLVALSDGTVYGFFRNQFDQLGYIRLQAVDRFALDYPYLTLGDEISGNNGTILDADTQAGCGTVWNSPSATVTTDAEGGEQIVVMARDNDLLRGSLRIARLSHANDPDASRRTWQCQTSSFAGMTLGSTPAVFANRWNNTVDVFGKTHPDVIGNGNFLALWRGIRGETSAVGIASFEEHGSIARDEISYPWSQPLALAVHDNGEAGGSVHLFYRTANGQLGHSYNADPAHNDAFASELVSETRDGVLSLPSRIANAAPSSIVDPRGILHVFTRLQSGAGLYHYFKTADAEWQGEALNIPVGSGESSPVALLVP